MEEINVPRFQFEKRIVARIYRVQVQGLCNLNSSETSYM